MLVFSDRHHESLYSSLVMLFEDRLGGELYYPLGMEWYEQGYWNVYPHPATAKQYLSLDQLYHPEDGTPPLNQIMEIHEGIFSVESTDTHKYIKGIRLDKFKEMRFDILIATLPQHIEPFKKLISTYQPQAKLIYQIGNQWNIDLTVVKNVMASANIDIPKDVNGVIYHQEFDLNIFDYTPVPMAKKIYSFINCLSMVDIYRKDWELFLELERLLPDWEFKSFGGQCRDGWCNGTKELADKMKEAAFIFACKNEGDGYGHVIHNAAAIGRPLIVRKSDYDGKLAEPLLEMSTSIYVDNKTPQEIASEIQETHDNGFDYLKGKRIYTKFKEQVNFDHEIHKIRNFLDFL